MASSARIDNASAVHLRTPPGPRGAPLLGSMVPFMKDNMGFIKNMAARYGDVVKYRVANLSLYQVNHPDGVQRVLQENNRNYRKGDLTTRLLGQLIGNSVFISEGEPWLRRRRLMQPAFHKQRIEAFGELMTTATSRMLDRWEAHAAQGRPLDAALEMTRLTAEIATQALFSSQVNDETNAISRAVATLLEDVNYRFQVPFYPPPSVPTLRNRRHHAALRTIDRAIYGIINRRKQQHNDTGDDLLAMLMEVRDEATGEGLTDKELRDEVITFFVAGHETTANTLSWTWYLLSQHPAEEQRLHAELQSVLRGRTPSTSDLPSLPYTRMVIDESMRLYPPAWITSRQAVADDEICGYHIPAGAVAVVSPYVMHHHPAYWDAPERFDPERFSPERSKGRPHYAYFPFGGGPRICIGKGFALVEAPLVLATIAQRYRLRLLPGHKAEPQAVLTLRPRDGVPMYPVLRTED